MLALCREGRADDRTIAAPETAMPDPAYFTLLLLLVSPAAGSFIALLADRLPRRESVVAPRSACRSCGAGLRTRDLVPVLSFLIARGRCRHCDSTLPAWLLYTEIAAIGAACLAAALGGTALQIWLTALILWLLLALAVTDVLWMRLPDVLTAALTALAVLWPLLFVPTHPALPDSLIVALAGAAAGSLSFWLIRLGYRQLRGREGLGLGDVKLMAGLGALCGPWLLAQLVLLAALTTIAAALAGSLTQGRSALKAGRALPFGAALCAAAGFLWVFCQLPN